MQDVYTCKVAYEAKQFREDNQYEVLAWINDVQYKKKKEFAFIAKGRIFIPVDSDTFIVVPKNTWVVTCCDDKSGFITATDEAFKRDFSPMLKEVDIFDFYVS